jgi:hypothetical protein
VKRVILPVTAITAFALSASSFAATQQTVSTAALSSQVSQLSAQTKKLEREVALLKKKKHKKAVRAKHKIATEKSHAKGPWSHYVTVTTTPFMGKQLAYDGSDLLYNVTTINEDMRLLDQKKLLENEMAAQGYALDRPILQLSGEVEGMASSVGGFTGPTNNSITLSTAELQMNAIASSWASAFMSMNFTGAPISTGNREPISTIYLGRGFVTLGNFNRSPIYFSAGLMYPPFGRYANSMVSSPMTLSMAKIRTPAALLGFKLNDGLFGSVYGFTGSETTGPNEIIRQEGVNLGYKRMFEATDSLSVGAGWVSNIADSQGMQGTGYSTAGGKFGGFGVANAGTGLTNNNALVHAVDGIDGHASLGLGRFTFLGEYLTSGRSFSPADLSYNGKGATPAAAHAEVDYMLPFFAKKYSTAIGVSYDHAWEALGLNLPENKYAVFLNTSIWRETTESIEFNHQTDYANGATASGRGATQNIVGTGKGDNSLLAEVGVYF